MLASTINQKIERDLKQWVLNRTRTIFWKI